MTTGTLTGNSHNVLSEESSLANNLDLADVKEIIIACPTGVGSSAVGAKMLRKKIEQENLNIAVKNVAIRKLSEDVKIVITQDKLTDEAKTYAPNAHHISLSNFLDNKLYTSLVASLKEAQ